MFIYGRKSDQGNIIIPGNYWRLFITYDTDVEDRLNQS